MNHKSVYAIATSEIQASQIVDQLTKARFSSNDISLLSADKRSSHEFSHEKHTKAPEGAITGATAGGAIGGALGLLMGIGALAIPGVGPFIAAGPLLAALSGAAAGASVGGVTGGLIGLGIPEIEAKRFENRISTGNILISVHAKSSDEVSEAKKILREAGAEDICVSTMNDVAASQPS